MALDIITSGDPINLVRVTTLVSSDKPLYGGTSYILPSGESQITFAPGAHTGCIGTVDCSGLV